MEKCEIKMLVLGHVGSGSSITTEHLVRKLGGNNKHVIASRPGKEVAEMNLRSSMPLLEKLKADHERGNTIGTSSLKFETTKNSVTVTGIYNLITGTSKADSALLIVDSTVEGFDVGISNDGQTFEHALLVRALGIEQLIVCFNKIFDCFDIVPCRWMPLRLPIRDFTKIDRNNTFLDGRIAAGILKPGMVISFGPTGHTAKVKSVQICCKDAQEATAGDNVGVFVKKVNAKDLGCGFVASNSNDDPAKEVVSFTSLLIITNFPGLLFTGCTLTLDCHEARVAVKVTEILRKIDQRSGKEIETKPKFLKNGDAAVVKMVPIKPIVVEAFSDYPSLGRFVVRDEHQIVVVGVIESVEKKEYASGASSSEKFDAKRAAKYAASAAKSVGLVVASAAIQYFIN